MAQFYFMVLIQLTVSSDLTKIIIYLYYEGDGGGWIRCVLRVVWSKTWKSKTKKMLIFHRFLPKTEQSKN